MLEDCVEPQDRDVAFWEERLNLLKLWQAMFDATRAEHLKRRRDRHPAP